MKVQICFGPKHALLITIALFVSATAQGAVYTVDSTFDTGDNNPGDGVCEATSGGTQCTLRAAIEEANANANTDQIEFSIGLFVLNVSSALPTISNRVRIDGRTAPGYNNAASDTGDAPPSVYISGAGLGGSTADGFRILNTVTGIEIFAIGIIDFPDNGIEIIGTDLVELDGNWIGTSRGGSIAGNSGAGIYVDRCSGCKVGKWDVSGSLAGIGNLISNNGEDGIFMTLGGNNEIGGNYIGLDVLSGQQHGNGGHGINLISANNEVGVYISGVTAPNFIWHNGGDGIHTEAGGNRILVNNVQQNTGNGMSINGGSNLVGLMVADSGNFVVQNGDHGIEVGNDLPSSSNEIRNNRIIENGFRGVNVTDGNSNTISGNTIWGNSSGAIRADTNSNQISTNLVGIANGIVQGNGDNGIILNGDNNVVSSNTIAGVDANGVQVTSGDGNQVLENLVGSGPAGEDWGNNQIGVRVGAAATSTLVSGNVIGHNALDGVLLVGGGTSVCDNHIGLGLGFEAAGNGVEGVLLQGGGNVIGDTGNGCAGNYIGNSGSDGIQINSDANVIRDNYIGGVGTVDQMYGNSFGGILLTQGADLNEIIGNDIVRNGDDGVRISTTAGTRNRIQENFFWMNGDLSIDINLDGVTNNDPGDGDTGPNNVQNWPDLDLLFNGVNDIEITYRVNSDLANATYPMTVDFYLSSSTTRHGEFVHRDVYALAPNTQKTISFDPGPSTGYIFGMITDADGNSSELGFPVQYRKHTLVDIEKLTNGAQADSANGGDVPVIFPGDPVTWTYLVTNIGPYALSFGDITVTDSVAGVSPVFDIASDDGSDLTWSPGEEWVYEAQGTALILSDPANSDVVVTGCNGASGATPGTNAYQNTGTATIPGDSDIDDSHYCNPSALVNIEKLTNGIQADNENGADLPVLTPGDPVEWTYLVTNTGGTQVPLADISVTDSVAGVNPVRDPASDDGGDNTLSPGEQWVYEAQGVVLDLADPANSGVTVVGCIGAVGAVQPSNAYKNTGTVTIPTQSDTDDSHYCNTGPMIVIEKLTNGSEADNANNPDVPVLLPGDMVEWAYLVTNTGGVSIALADISVTDNVAGVNPVRDPSSDDGGDGILSPGEEWTYEAQGVALDLGDPANAGVTVTGCNMASGAVPGSNAYHNTGTVIVPGTGQNDESHYCNPAAPMIDIEKMTNGQDADFPTGPVVPIGENVTFEYMVLADSFNPLENVVVVDDNGTPGNTGDDFNPTFTGGDSNMNGFLDNGEIWTYEASHTATEGQYTNIATVTAMDSLTGVEASDDDASNHLGSADLILQEGFE